MLNPLAAVGVALAIGAATVASPALRQPQVVVPERQQAATVRKEPREAHPEIRKAITALERAKYDMQHAAHDFGGHRVAAIAACDNAIAQLRLALQYDKR